MANYIFLYHRGGEITLDGFIKKNYIYKVTDKELLDINRDLIFSQMTFNDKLKETKKGNKFPLSSSDITINTYLPSPCVLKIDASKVTAELAINQTNAQVNTNDFYAFADEKIQDIYQNAGYQIDTSSKREIDCQVFGWFKSLYYTGLDYKGKSFSTINEFINISSHVISLTTSVTENGGSFVLRLPVISARAIATSLVGKKGEDGAFEAFGAMGQVNVATNSFGESGEYFAKTSMDDVEANYFSWLFSENDLLFLSFEKLKLEDERGKAYSGYEKDFNAAKALTNGVFDMIALVDEVKISYSTASSDAYVEISGRDLMKLLIDDGSFFFMSSTVSNPSEVFANESSGKQGDIKDAELANGVYSNPVNRIRNVSGEINVFANRKNTEISFILKGVLSMLANVEIVPGYVFEPWGEDRTKYIELEPKKK